MKIALAQIITSEIMKNSKVITKLSDELYESFGSEFFGGDVENLTIGIVCVNPQFEAFFNTEKKYYKGSRRITHDGITPLNGSLYVKSK